MLFMWDSKVLFNTFKELEDILHANTVNNLHEDVYKNPNTTSKVTRNSEAVFTSVTQQPHTYLKNSKNSCISNQ